MKRTVMAHKAQPMPPMEGSLKATAEVIGVSMQKRQYEWITSDELKALIDAGEQIVFVDCRDEGTYAFGHIEGAINVPFRHFMEQVSQVPRGGLVVVGCYFGFYSRVASQKLAKIGHQDVLSLKGGVKSWMDAGYPVVETEQPRP